MQSEYPAAPLAPIEESGPAVAFHSPPTTNAYLAQRNPLIKRYAKARVQIFPVHPVVFDSGSPGAGECPCPGADCANAGKHPKVRWKSYDSRTLSNPLKDFGPRDNVGMKTGSEAQLLVLDFDEEASFREAERRGWVGDNPVAKTGRAGGYQVFYRYPEGKDIKNHTEIFADLPGVDVRGEGGMVIVPPSIHWTGKQYEWLNWGTLGAPPVDLLDKLVSAQEAKKSEIREMKFLTKNFSGEVVPVGRRNDTLASLGGRMRRMGLTRAEVFSYLHSVNQRLCEEPLPDQDVDNLADYCSGSIRPGDRTLLKSILKTYRYYKADVSWKGVGRATEYALIMVALKQCLVNGILTGSFVSFGIAQRTWAEKAGTKRKRIGLVLGRLVPGVRMGEGANGYIVKGARREEFDSNTYLLLIPDPVLKELRREGSKDAERGQRDGDLFREPFIGPSLHLSFERQEGEPKLDEELDEEQAEDPEQAVDEEVLDLLPRLDSDYVGFRWGPGFLNPSDQRYLNKLLVHHDGSAQTEYTRAEIAEILGVKPGSLSRFLSKMSSTKNYESAILPKVGHGRYAIPDNIRDGIELRREATGQEEVSRRVRRAHRLEQELYRQIISPLRAVGLYKCFQGLELDTSLLNPSTGEYLGECDEKMRALLERGLGDGEYVGHEANRMWPEFASQDNRGKA